MPRYRRKLNLNRKIKKTLNSMLKKKMEVKREIQVHNISVDTTGVAIPLMNTIASGTAHDQRIGNRVNMLSTTLRYMWSLSDTGYNNCRISLIKVKVPLPPSTVPVATPPDFYENQSYSAFSGVYASWNYDLVSKVYYDKNITLNQFVAGARASKFNKAFIKMAQELNYDTALAPSLLDGIYLVVSTDSAVVPHPGLNLVTRCRYTDA